MVGYCVSQQPSIGHDPLKYTIQVDRGSVIGTMSSAADLYSIRALRVPHASPSRDDSQKLWPNQKRTEVTTSEKEIYEECSQKVKHYLKGSII